jgi:hypothetical protein
MKPLYCIKYLGAFYTGLTFMPCSPFCRRRILGRCKHQRTLDGIERFIEQEFPDMPQMLAEIMDNIGADKEVVE